MKRSPMPRRTTPLRSKGFRGGRAVAGEGAAMTPPRRIRPRTPQQKRRAADDRAYRLLNAAFRLARPWCQVCGARTTDVHHRRGRGEWYLVVETWAACCRSCHRRAHADRTWGEAVGLVESRLAKRGAA